MFAATTDHTSSGRAATRRRTVATIRPSNDPLTVHLLVEPATSGVLVSVSGRANPVRALLLTGRGDELSRPTDARAAPGRVRQRMGRPPVTATRAPEM